MKKASRSPSKLQLIVLGIKFVFIYQTKGFFSPCGVFTEVLLEWLDISGVLVICEKQKKPISFAVILTGHLFVIYKDRKKALWSVMWDRGVGRWAPTPMENSKGAPIQWFVGYLAVNDGAIFLGIWMKVAEF